MPSTAGFAASAAQAHNEGSSPRAFISKSNLLAASRQFLVATHTVAVLGLPLSAVAASVDLSAGDSRSGVDGSRLICWVPLRWFV